MAQRGDDRKHSPHWFDCVGFVLWHAHDSMLIYALLPLTGYALPIQVKLCSEICLEVLENASSGLTRLAAVITACSLPSDSLKVSRHICRQTCGVIASNGVHVPHRGNKRCCCEITAG